MNSPRMRSAGRNVAPSDAVHGDVGSRPRRRRARSAGTHPASSRRRAAARPCPAHRADGREPGRLGCLQQRRHGDAELVGLRAAPVLARREHGVVLRGLVRLDELGVADHPEHPRGRRPVAGPRVAGRAAPRPRRRSRGPRWSHRRGTRRAPARRPASRAPTRSLREPGVAPLLARPRPLGAATTTDQCHGLGDACDGTRSAPSAAQVARALGARVSPRRKPSPHEPCMVA